MGSGTPAAPGSAPPVDAHQCGADGDVEEPGGAGGGDPGGELVLHVLEGDAVGKKAI